MSDIALHAVWRMSNEAGVALEAHPSTEHDPQHLGSDHEIRQSLLGHVRATRHWQMPQVAAMGQKTDVAGQLTTRGVLGGVADELVSSTTSDFGR